MEPEFLSMSAVALKRRDEEIIRKTTLALRERFALALEGIADHEENAQIVVWDDALRALAEDVRKGRFEMRALGLTS